jgi:hypothetical protein
MTTRLRLFTVLLLTVIPSFAWADPIHLTGGNVQAEVHLHSARMTFSGNRFQVRIATDEIFTPLSTQIVPLGSPVNLGAEWQMTDVRAGSATFQGVTYLEPYFGFGLSHGTFVTPLVIPDSDSLFVTVSAPFTFNGVFTGFSDPEMPLQSQLFSTRVVGSGLATASFHTEYGYYVPTAREGADYQLLYAFTDMTPVPEPSTLLLVGAGTACLAAKRRRRRGAI